MKLRSFIAAGLLSAVLPAGAWAAEMMYKANLTGAQEVPANGGKGAGTAELTYDTVTKLLKWKVIYSGLSGPATGAHIHGPAEPGKAAPVEIAFPKATSPIDGSATLTAAQAADLEGGKLYINVHTAEHKDGEIRGQVLPLKRGASLRERRF